MNEFPLGEDATLEVSTDWDGTPEGIDAATWLAIDGIGDTAVSEGAPDVPDLRVATISNAGPVTTVITLNGWRHRNDAGQAALEAARGSRAKIGFRWRPDGTAATGECYVVRVGPRNHRASAQGGLQPVVYPLIALTHAIQET